MAYGFGFEPLRVNSGKCRFRNPHFPKQSLNVNMNENHEGKKSLYDKNVLHSLKANNMKFPSVL